MSKDREAIATIIHDHHDIEWKVNQLEQMMRDARVVEVARLSRVFVSDRVKPFLNDYQAQRYREIGVLEALSSRGGSDE